LSIVKQQAGQKGLRYFPLFFVIFFLILFSNLIGLVPFTFTPTSHIVITFTLAFTCNLAFIIIGFKENGLSFLRLFVPNGSPRFLLPIIVVIEFISYLLRTFSLSIRLFANIMAGHTLMHILASFVTAFLNVLPIFALFPFIIVLAVVILEVCIAFLQAYVFLILFTIYLEDSFHPSH
jgi:ATP synthase subunit 6